MKPETEDSSSSSSSSSGNESSEEEVLSKQKKKKLPPPPPVKKRDRSQSPHHSRHKSQSLNLDRILQSERGAGKADQNLQEGVVGANVYLGPGVVLTQGHKDLHHIKRDPSVRRIGDHHIR